MSILTAAEQVKAIRKEWREKKKEPVELVIERIRSGDAGEAGAQLLFRIEPEERERALQLLESRVPALFDEASPERKVEVLGFCVNLALDFGSFLPDWRAGAPQTNTHFADRLRSLAVELAAHAPDASGELQAGLRNDMLARLNAEGVSDEGEAGRIADGLLENGLGRYVEKMWGEYRASNTRRLAEACLKGETATALGNDYAAFLEHALRVGASSQTTNPVLIKLAWDTDRDGWNRRVDRIILSAYDREAIRRTLNGSEEQRDAVIRRLNSLVTTAVVERNCRMLRDIFLMTDGREGYVNLQVSPESYAESDAMVEQAVEVYEDLRGRLGGVPNVVIKVPATPAGKEAAAQLTRRGIGVTMTLTFSMFQAIELAEVIRDGHALVSNIALMNGRLAYPVRDELSAAEVAGGAEAARWAGVAAARRVYHRLYRPAAEGGMGIDPARVRLLIASLRIYDDWFPDITEMLGVPVITVFPNVRRAFDAHPRELNLGAVSDATPAAAIRTMLASELFRQAWWIPEDGEDGKPERPLSLAAADAEAVASWTPVKDTLTQFIEGYHSMNRMIDERLRRLGE